MPFAAKGSQEPAEPEQRTDCIAIWRHVADQLDTLRVVDQVADARGPRLAPMFGRIERVAAVGVRMRLVVKVAIPGIVALIGHAGQQPLAVRALVDVEPTVTARQVGGHAETQPVCECGFAP